MMRRKLRARNFLVMYKTSLLIYCSCILVVQTTQALPSGSVGCEGGQAAVGGLHTSAAQQTIVTGPLSQDFIDFEINGVPLQPGVPFDIEIGVDHQWKLVATGSPFRGFLARLGRGDSNVDTRSTLWTDSDSAQIAQRACIEAYLVGGVTHTNNDLKTEEEGTLRMELPSQNMQLDVTVVIQNRGGLSVYYYSGFTIHANPPVGSSSVANEDTTLDLLNNFDNTVPCSSSSSTGNSTNSTSVLLLGNTTTIHNTSDPTLPIFDDASTTVSTSQPTISPIDTTNSPTFAPTTTSNSDSTTQSNTPLLLRPRVPACSRENPCDKCLECDRDDDCREGLVCSNRKRDKLTPIFGCSGAGIAGQDYCFNETAAMLAESTSAQLEENEPPSVATPPPPTTTTTESESEVVETTDDDSNQQAIMLTDRDNICTSDDPCNVCEGDCLGNDASCSGDLECFYRPTGDNTRVPGCFGAGQAGISYCWVPIEETLVMRSPTRPPCSSRQPCDKCEGSCQQDVDCFDGLSCTERLEDLTLVPGCGNGFAGLNFCFDPAEDKSSKKDDNKGRNAGIHSPTTRRRRHLLRGERRS